MRRRRTELRTVRSTPAKARSTAARSDASRFSNTTVGNPFGTTLFRHTRSTPPRGPLASSIRTLTRWMERANLPSRLSSLCRMWTRSSEIALRRTNVGGNAWRLARTRFPRGAVRLFDLAASAALHAELAQTLIGTGNRASDAHRRAAPRSSLHAGVVCPIPSQRHRLASSLK